MSVRQTESRANYEPKKEDDVDTLDQLEQHKLVASIRRRTTRGRAKRGSLFHHAMTRAIVSILRAGFTSVNMTMTTSRNGGNQFQHR
jgi:hypothetical protein